MQKTARIKGIKNGLERIEQKILAYVALIRSLSLLSVPSLSLLMAGVRHL